MYQACVHVDMAAYDPDLEVELELYYANEPELEVELIDRDVRLRAGERGTVEVRLRNLARSEIRGEAQIVSPHETWPAITPWTQGFTVAPGKTTTVTFAVEPPFDFPGGTWWALVKVMYFGRLSYTESVPIEIAAATRVETPVPA